MIHEEINIKLKRVEEKAYLDIKDVAYHFWDIFFSMAARYVGYKGGAGRVIKGYLDLCIDDLRWEDDEISLIFHDAAGYCPLSSQFSFHIAELILTLNREGVKKMFRSLGWEMLTDFGSLKEAREKQRYHFFEYKRRLHAITSDREGQPYIVSDQGEEFDFDRVDKKKREGWLEILKDRKCQCPVCTTIRTGRMNPEKIAADNIAENEREQYSIRKALKYHRVVEELKLSSDSDIDFEELSKLKGLKKLDLSNCDLDELPASIGSLTNLTSLNLDSNRLTELPAAIGLLKKLTYLSIYFNPIEKLNESFCNLTNLETFYFGDTEIEELSERLGQLKKLHTLTLPGCLKSLPSSLTDCPELEIVTIKAGLNVDISAKD